MISVRQLLDRKGREVFSIDPGAAVLDAVRMMADRHVGALLVMQGDNLTGIISERDYARKVILLGRSSADTPVRDIMSTPVLTVQPETTVEKCMQIMTEQRVRHLPVAEGGRVVGMVSIGDLVKAVIAEQQQQIEQLESYIHS
ncbi:MAG: CBS domain-containing protein [Steroidobacteraceae bacterium]|jgi:CBS domain-containing protein